jgi:predicted  nucleic acid-binding Zn-ribbon protein
VFPEHDSPDHVIVEFINEETWQPDEVVCALPGSAMLRPYRLQIPGIVKRDQAWREGISLAAQNRDQRRFVSFQTELEGHIPRYGDLVEISHDVPKWGLTGFIEDYDPGTKTLTTSESLEWWPSENHYINLRKKDGSPDGPYRVVAGSHDREAVIADLLDGYAVFVSDGQGEEFTHYQFGPGERRSLLAQAVSAAPDEQGHVALEFVNYAESVHAAENGGVVPPPNPVSLLPTTPNAPVVNEVTVYATPVAGEQIASCTPARGAQVYEFQASDDLGASWTSLGSDTTSSIRIRLPVGPWWVRARGVGAMPGPWKLWQGHITATMLPPPALSLLATESLNWGIRISWAWPSAISLRYIEIWYSPTPNFLDATLLGLFAYPQSSHDMMGLALNSQFYFWARVRDEADQPGPWYPENGSGVRGTPNQTASDYNGLITQEIVAGGLGELIMGDIESIPGIKDTLSDIGVDVEGLRQDVDQHAVVIAEIPQIKDVLTDLGVDVTGLEDEINALQAEVADIVGAPNWDAQAQYLVGQIVKFDGSLYRAIKNVPVGTPVGNASYWEKIGDYDSLGQAVAALLVRMSNAEVSLDDLTGELIAQSQEILALQSDLTGLDGKVSGQAQLLGGLRTSVSELDGVVTSEAARTSSIIASLREDDGQGQLDAVLNEWDSRAWIQRTEKAVVDNQKAQASINEQLGVQIGDNTAQIGSLSDVVATLDQSTAMKLDRLESSLGGLDGELAGQAGALDLLKTDVSRIDGGLTAQATSISQLESGVADNKSAIQTVSQTVASEKAAQVQVNQQVQSDLAGLDGAVSGQAQALDKLETSVSEIDDAVTSEAARTSSIIASLREDDGQGQLDGALNDWDSRAWIQRTEKAVVDNQKAQATVNEQLGVQIGDNTAQIGSLSDVVATLDQSTAIKLDQLQTSLGGLDGQVAGQAGALDLLKTDVSRIDGEVTAQATSISQLESGVANNKSAIQTVGQTVADNKSAQAQVNQQVQSSIGDVAASAQESTEAIATLDGKIASSWAVKLQGNQNGVKYVAGVGLDLTNESGVTQSTFAVLADRFAVMHAVNGVPATVFSVQGGASILNSALIGNASITEAKIANAAIGRAKIQDAAINAAKIENAAITSAKIQDAAIKTAHIGHAEVDTLRIAGNAVAIQAGASRGVLYETYRAYSLDVHIYLAYPASVTIVAVLEKSYSNYPGSHPVVGELDQILIDGSAVHSLARGTDTSSLTLSVGAGSHRFTFLHYAKLYAGENSGAHYGKYQYGPASISVVCTMR